MHIFSERAERRLAVATLLMVSAALAAADASPSCIDAKTVKERFAEVTAQDMELLRSKRILFASRSFGLNLCKGLGALAKQDKRFELLGSYQRYDVFKAGGDLGIIPPDAFDRYRFVHFMASYWPHIKRVEEMGKLLGEAPHAFGGTADIAVIFFHTAVPEAFPVYAKAMDGWRARFPALRVVYVTAGFMGPVKAKENEQAHLFSEQVRARYRGQATIYDLGAILSDDFRAGHAFCPEYSADPAGVHPNTAAGEAAMAKGFLLALRDVVLKKQLQPAPGVVPAQADPKAETLPASHPDVRAVRAMLDANGLVQKQVESVAVVRGGRVVELYLQEGGMITIPDAIGTLTALEVLHCYGDPGLPYPCLTVISPAIGHCTKLRDLLLNGNDLTTLPVEIAQLQNVSSLSLAGNRLDHLPPVVTAWAQRHDAKGLADQRRP